MFHQRVQRLRLPSSTLDLFPLRATTRKDGTRVNSLARTAYKSHSASRFTHRTAGSSASFDLLCSFRAFDIAASYGFRARQRFFAVLTAPKPSYTSGCFRSTTDWKSELGTREGQTSIRVSFVDALLTVTTTPWSSTYTTLDESSRETHR
jgi:hypothetical protein